MKDCGCQDRLEELGKQIRKTEIEVNEANKEDGPYWGRMVASDFLKRLSKKVSRINCSCGAAKKINQIFNLLNNPNTEEAIAESGGGSMKNRIIQDSALYLLKKIFHTSEPLDSI